jgi:hypothetical protein
MRRIRIKSGGHVNILGMNEASIPGEINFTEPEWRLAQRLLNDQRDPESKKSFWETLAEKKRDISYSLFEDFPDEETSGLALGVKRATEILNMLKGKRKWHGEESA